MSAAYMDVSRTRVDVRALAVYNAGIDRAVGDNRRRPEREAAKDRRLTIEEAVG